VAGEAEAEVYGAVGFCVGHEVGRLRWPPMACPSAFSQRVSVGFVPERLGSVIRYADPRFLHAVFSL
jgi:hypothetical protein